MIELIHRNIDVPYDDVTQLMQETGLARSLCYILCARGIKTPEAVHDFLNPSENHFHDSMMLPDMEKAIERIKKAVSRKELICVFGDYDADGMCAAAMLVMYLKHIGANAVYRVPLRHNDGYGLSVPAVEHLAGQNVGLIITVDNGIAANEAAVRARELGVELIITDHHRCAEELPECVACVCASVPGNTYPNSDLCGAGVALKLIEAHGGREAARAFLPFAGLATVADVVPMTGENRAIVALALKMINGGECPVGIRALADIAGIEKHTITEYDLGFGIAPRLNASGRIEDAAIGVELLCSVDSDMAMELASNLNDLNKRRKDEEQVILAEAYNRIKELDLQNTRCIVVKSENWNPGVLGIAASRICERYYRPVVLFSESDGKLTGSARSIREIDIHSVLSRFSDMFIKFGGHAYAAGITMMAEGFGAFRGVINEWLEKNSTSRDYIPKQSFDSELRLNEISEEFISSLERFAPFGTGNPRPSFVTRDVSLKSLKVIGSNARHLNGVVYENGNELGIVAFNSAHRFYTLLDADSLDIHYSPALNTWLNKTRVQLRINAFVSGRIKSPAKYIFAHNDKFLDAFWKNIVYTNKHGVTGVKNNTIVCNVHDIVKREFERTFTGNVLLCFTAEGAMAALNALNEWQASADIFFGAPEEYDPIYNCLVFAPNIERLRKTADCASNVFVFDTALMPEATDALASVFCNASVYLHGGGEYTGKAILNELCDAIKRENMGLIYSNATSLVRGSEAIYREQLIERVSLRTNIKKTVCELALTVFEELGFIYTDANGAVRQSNVVVKCPLENSTLYRCVHAQCL